MAEQIVEYDARWPEYFAAEAQRFWPVLSQLAIRIDHIGSTAVPGLAAKPTIDIQVVVRSRADIPTCHALLLAHDYREATVPIVYLYRPAAWPHSHHVHVRELGSGDEQRLCAFRDWLREHQADREAYLALKRQLARNADLRHLEERARYSEAKGSFVRDIERRAGLGHAG